MTFFQRNFYTPESSFTPLFRLLDDFDSYSRQGDGQPQQQQQQQHGRRSAAVQWQPRFDVRETTDAYELHGELPGVSKDDVYIEFTDPQTMLIHGKVERSYTAGTPLAGQLEAATVSEAITEGGEEQAKPSHRATIEDETSEASQDGTLATQSGGQIAKAAARQPNNTVKYWLSERSIGEFSRSFSFPTHVSQDHVTASFKEGILSIAVPKVKKHEARRIAVN